MRPRVPLLLVFFLSLGGTARAADHPIAVRSVQFGFPIKPHDEQAGRAVFKAAKWMPVRVTVEAVGNLEDKSIEINASVPDGDDVISEARIKVPAPSPGGPTTHTLYLKPGGVTSEVSVTVRGAETGRTLAAPASRRLIGLPPSRYTVLSVGSTFDGFRVPRVEGQVGEVGSEQDSWRNGWVHFGRVANLEQLPDQWFGYDGVDVLVLADVERHYWNELLGDRRNAIAEWVRRGGRLIISGRTFSWTGYAIFGEQLPFVSDPDNKEHMSVPELALVLPNLPRLVLRPEAGKRVRLEPIKQKGTTPFHTRLLADERESPPPLVVQSSLGLGRVTLVTFDLHIPPFTTWPHREAFWEWLLNQAGTRLPTGQEPIVPDAAGEEEDAYLNRQLTDLETYEGIPVVSFGWVALLILGYILLIGPFEYLLLKKLFKRLEWTWLTFPIIVAATCAFAYYAAVSVKGRELKINKVDVVDLDMEGKRVYGQSWFGVFSPKAEAYGVAIEPSWEPSVAADRLVSWHGKARNTRQSLFRRSYRYHVGDGAYADSLEGVPIAIWSTKALTSRWSAPLEKPLIESTLRRSAADPNQITGSITSRLPVEAIENARLFYRGRVIEVPTLLPGVPRYVFSGPQSATAVSWLHAEIPQKDLFATTRDRGPDAARREENPRFRLWPALFHDEVQGQFNRLSNASFRELDESWRFEERNTNQAVLVARLKRENGPVKEMSRPERAPTRLLLNGITPAGSLRQETYLRIYLPVPATGP